MMMFLDWRFILRLLMSLLTRFSSCHCIFVVHNKLLFLGAAYIFMGTYLLECNIIASLALLLVVLIKRAFVFSEHLLQTWLSWKLGGFTCNFWQRLRWHGCGRGCCIMGDNWCRLGQWWKRSLGCLHKEEGLRGSNGEGFWVEGIEKGVHKSTSLLNFEILLWKVRNHLILQRIVEIVKLIKHPLQSI